MVDSGLRARVQRLLLGEIRSDDLTRLFLYARDRCDGRESVREIGDFVAHHDERTKGIVTRSVRDWAITARFKLERTDVGAGVNGNSLPPETPEFLRAQFRRTANDILRKDVGVDRARAEKLLTSAIRGLKRNADGTWALSPSTYVGNEFAIVQCMFNYLIVQCAFTPERLFKDFVATLKSHGLLEKAEVRPFAALAPIVSLFAITSMNQCVIILDDGGKVTLTAIARNNKIAVDAGISIKFEGRNEVSVISPMYEADLLPDDHCDPELLKMGYPWNFYLELNSNGKLSRLG